MYNPEKNYWTHKGRYQKEADAVKELVPNVGMADTLTGEAVRVLSGAYYDLYNNGGCNERLEDLQFVYDWLYKHGVDYDEIGKVNYNRLYKSLSNEPEYFARVASRLEALADSVFVTAYNLERQGK